MDDSIASGLKLSNQLFNQFLTVGSVNQQTGGLVGLISGIVLITMI
jgi:hypothetical protein